MASKAVFVKSGDTMNVKPSAAVNCGDIKVIAGCVCIALWDIPQGVDGTLKILHKGEIVKVTVETAIGATDAGVGVYVDGDGVVSKTSTGTLVGYTAAAVGATDTVFEVVCA